MLVTIRNLPANTRYADLKALIVSKCGLTEMILDNLMPDGMNAKKVTVGLAEEEDAAILMRKINGLVIEGHQVYVESVKKKQGPETDVSWQPSLHQPYYQQSSYRPSQQLGYTDLQQNAVPPVSYAGMYGATNTQNAFANYGYPQQMQFQSNQMMAQSVANFNQDAPLGFSNQVNNSSVWANQNDWNPARSGSDGNRTSQQNRNNSRWDNSDDIGRPRRDASARDRGRDGSSRNFGQDAPVRDVGRKATRDFGRDAPSRGYGRDAPSRDRGRDAPRDQRDRRDAPHRERAGDVQARAGREPPARSASARDYTRNDFERGPPKRQFSANNAPGKSSGFVSQMNKFSYQRDNPGQNRNTLPKAAPNMARKAKSENIPPAKRQRTVVYSDTKGPANTAQSQTSTKKKAKKNDPETLLNRAATWRCQIASSVARDIIKNPELKIQIEEPQFLTELKRGIRHRLEMLFGSDVNISQTDMLTIYREKYSVDSDAEFFKEVTEDIENHGAYVADDTKKAEPGSKKEGAGTVKKILSNPQAVVTKEEYAETIKKIPSYPQGDKRLNKELKKASVMIFQDTDSLVSRLKPNMQKALDEEVGDMAALIAEEFQDEPEPEYETFHKRVKTTVIDEYNQMVKVNVAKRILKIRPIMLRIFNYPKIINRSKLAPILAEYGIDSLRKSEKKPPMYFGTCKTYEQHDKLCAMEPLVVDGCKVVIKPFQLTGFNEKLTKKQIKLHRQKISETFSNNADDFTEDIDEFNEEVDEEIGNLNEEDDENQGQSDNDQPENENQEPEEENKEIEASEIVENGDTKKNGNELESDETQEIYENDNAEKPESADKENSTEAVSTEVASVESKENEEVVAPAGVQCDLTANKDETQIEDDSSKIDGKLSENDIVDADKDITNPSEDAEDDGRENYEDIDIDDLNDDDLEDW